MTGTSDTLETNPEIPDDHEALSLNKITEFRIPLKTVTIKNELTDTFAMDHQNVLSKLNLKTTKVLASLSPIDRAGLPYFEKYTKKDSREYFLKLKI